MSPKVMEKTEVHIPDKLKKLGRETSRQVLPARCDPEL